MLLCYFDPDLEKVDLTLRESVRIWSYFGLYFPAFGLNTERYEVSLLILLTTFFFSFDISATLVEAGFKLFKVQRKTVT